MGFPKPVLLFLISGAYASSTNNMYAPLLPGFLEEKKISRIYSGYCLSTFAFGYFIFSYLTGNVFLNQFKCDRMKTLFVGFLIKNIQYFITASLAWTNNPNIIISISFAN